MLRHFHAFLSSALVALLFSCYASTVQAYGMECEKPTIVTAAGVTTSFSFDCTNSTTSAHFASYEIFPVCNDNSTPADICDSTTFIAAGCPHNIAPGAVCTVQGSFTPEENGVYILDFNDRYGSVTYYDIFCNDPAKDCIVADATTFAYVTPSSISPGNSIINQCPLNAANGEFLSCATAYHNDLQAYTALAFAVVAGKQYAYVTNQGGLIYKCTINAAGGFDNCTANTPTLTPTGWAPRAITFASIAGIQYAYVTDVNLGYIYQCSLDPTEGFLTSCEANTAISFEAPYAIHVATIGGSQYAYIGNAGNGMGFGQVYRCTFDNSNDGSLQTCTASPSMDAPNWIPYGIDFATVNGVQYAYVADNGTATMLPTPANGQMYKCSLDSSGFFSSCTPQNVAPTDGWNPSAIAFTTLSGTQYAYVPSYQGSSNGNMYSCSLTVDGSFETCTATPNPSPNPWAPTSIAFRTN